MDTSKKSIGEEAAAMKDRAAGDEDKLGEATSNPDLERRGEAQRATGRARQSANTVVTGSAGDYVTSFYSDPTEADKAFGRLKDTDYPIEDIDVVMSDETRQKHFPNSEMGSKAAEGLGVGGAVGGGVGAALAALFAVGSTIAVLRAGPRRRRSDCGRTRRRWRWRGGRRRVIGAMVGPESRSR